MKTEHYIDMKSPITGGKVILVEDVEEQEFRKEKYTVHVRYCVCEDSGEQFSVEGQDDMVLNQIYCQYRNEHGLPYPDEIVGLRVKYGLNYTQISKILGFGTNQWRQYESGVVPSESNGKMIVSIRSKQSMLALVDASRSEFSESEFIKIKASVASAKDADEKGNLRQLFYGRTERGVMNGFAEMNAERLQSMVRYLIRKSEDGICPTKLNKEMFYADFLHFRKHGVSISGLQYRAIQYGPVPEHYDTIYDNVEGLSKRIVFVHDSESVRLYCDCEKSDEILTEREKETLTFVAEYFLRKKTAEVVGISHQESAWQKYEKSHSMIPYSEAFGISLFA